MGDDRERLRRASGRGLCQVALLLAMAAAGAAQTRYIPVNIGGLGSYGSWAWGLNARGEVVGFSLTDSQAQHAFLYSGGHMIDLGTLGGTTSWAYAINASGQVVGWSELPDGRVHAFLYEGGVMMDLGTLGGGQSYARSINDSGQITGWAERPDGVSHAFLYSGGQMFDLDKDKDGVASDGFGINAGGLVVGRTNEYPPAGDHAVIYSGALHVNIFNLPALESVGWAINASGQAVGYFRPTDSLNQHAFLYSSGTVEQLGTLGGDQSVAYSINASGQIVGKADTTPGILSTRAFIYEGGHMTDLNTLLAAPLGIYGFLGVATGINDRGQIVATSGAYSFLLTPGSVTEPVPVITSLSPELAMAGGPAFQLMVTGNNFLTGAVVKWNGAPLSTTFLSGTQLLADVPAALIAAPGAASVTVMNPGGSTSNTVMFPIVGPPEAPILISPPNGATGVALAPTLSWLAAARASSYDVYFGTSSSPSFLANTTDTSRAPGTLVPGVTYYWRVVARNSFGSASSDTWSFITGTPPTGLRFVAVTPCRIADTRNTGGPFGGPSIPGGTARSFAVPQSSCGIPSSAQAYSLNVTAVPQGALYYLTLWPTGQSQPLVSTLNSWGGDVVANAAIVPAGAGGGVSVFVSNTADVILDINGYFDTSSGPLSYAFYPATPCRVADTRSAVGLFGGPSLVGGQSRGFPITSSGCLIPATARAFSLNFTVVPHGYLGYLSTWPTGQPQPLVSTLNSWKGKIVANAALVPAGTNESISVFASETTDMVLDINGYFAQPGSAGALKLYPVTPCRVADTRNANGPFGGPIMEGGESRSFAVPASVCGIPATAAAYSMNITVVPAGALPYLSAWPAGLPQPLVSTLNSPDGSVLANAAIIPAGTQGAISIFTAGRTHVVLDINGYFAP